MSVGNFKLFTSMLKNINSNSINRDMIGYQMEEVLPPITKEDILEYSKATRDPNPQYEEENAVLPPFFVAKLAMPHVKKIFTNKNLRLNLLRMVHGQQGVTWYKPLRINDELKVQGSIKDISDTPAGEFMQISGKIFSNGDLAAESISGFMVRGKDKNNKVKSKEPEPLAEAFRIELQTEEGQNLEYAKASGDNLFIHTNNILAKMAGLPGTIMHGICVMSMISSALIKELMDGDVTRLKGLDTRFSNPVLPGQKITIIGFKSSDSKVIPFKVINQEGKPVFKNGTLKYS